MTNFTFDESAIEKESVIGGRVTQSGDYTGRFTKVYETLGKDGAIGIRFDFVSDKGMDSSFTLWHTSKTGSSIDFQVDILQALMALMDLKELKGKPNTSIEVYDFNVGGVIAKNLTAYPQLIDKHIGVILQVEEYQKNNGGIGERANAVRFFDAKTRQTASEKLHDCEALMVDLIVSRLEPVKRLKLSPKAEQKAQDVKIIEQAKNQPNATVADFFNDDIQF